MRKNDSYKLLYNELWLLNSDGALPLSSVIPAQAGIHSWIKDSVRDDNSHALNSYKKENTTPIEIKSPSNPPLDEHIPPTILPNIPIQSQEPATDKMEITNMAAKKVVVHNQDLISDWNVLVDLANNCTNCGLCYDRTNVVIERGNRNAKWMFVGEGPGENEDLEGKPFVGRSGQLLDKMIAACNLDKDQDVYICNVVKCRPPKNRNPEIDEINACNRFLLSQINLVKPKVIVALGRIAAQMLLQTDTAIGKLRGEIHHLHQIPLVVTYHPAYLLRNPPAKKDTWEDLQLAIKIYTQE